MQGYTQGQINKQIILMQSAGIYRPARIAFAKNAPTFLNHFDKVEIWDGETSYTCAAISVDWEKTSPRKILDWAEPKVGRK